jgi:hypothetical protein
MKCLICSSDETEWLETIMLDQEEGYESYTCRNCRGKFDIGMKVTGLAYTSMDNVFPFEKE